VRLLDNPFWEKSNQIREKKKKKDKPAKAVMEVEITDLYLN
jgi:hypothetical protein